MPGRQALRAVADMVERPMSQQQLRVHLQRRHQKGRSLWLFALFVEIRMISGMRDPEQMAEALVNKAPEPPAPEAPIEVIFTKGSLQLRPHEHSINETDASENASAGISATASPSSSQIQPGRPLLHVANGSRHSLQLSNGTKSSPNTRSSSGQSAIATASAGVDLLVSETVNKAHHTFAQLLGVESGSLCPSSSGSNFTGAPKAFGSQGQKHGCRLGCRCGILQRCHSRSYLSSELVGLVGSSAAVDVADAAEAIDVGVCRFAFPAFAAIFVAVTLTVWIGAVCLRKAFSNSVLAKGAQRPKPMRAELEARLRHATALSNEQRKAILDEFCKKEEEQESAARLDLPVGGDFRVVAATS